MTAWIARRLVQALFIVVAMTAIVFVAVNVIGDPVQVLIAQDADEVEFLRTICDYVTVAYERVRLVKQLQDSDRRKDERLSCESRRDACAAKYCSLLVAPHTEGAGTNGDAVEVHLRPCD